MSDQGTLGRWIPMRKAAAPLLRQTGAGKDRQFPPSAFRPEASAFGEPMPTKPRRSVPLIPPKGFCEDRQ